MKETKLNVQIQQILTFVEKNPKCEVKNVIEKTGINRATVYKIMLEQRNAGKLNMTNKLYSLADVPAANKVKKPVAKIKAVAVVETVTEPVVETVTEPVTDETAAVVEGKNFGRDFSKLMYKGQEYRKGKYVHIIIFTFVKENPELTYAQFKTLIPNHDTLVRTFGLWKSNAEARNINMAGKQRYHGRRDMCIEFACGTRICITNQISKENFPIIIEACKKAGMIKELEYATLTA